MPFITLNKNNFFNNLDIITQKTQSKDKIALVLKDNAYGHGLKEIAFLAKTYGITKAVVRTCKEAYEILDFFDSILVLADTPQTPPPSKIRIAINSLEQIKTLPKNTAVELKVDTGMHRNGIDMQALNDAFALIAKRKLALKAVFTHHRSADEATSEWFWQNENFKILKRSASKLASKYGFARLTFHKDNSASLFRSTRFNEDVARIGIAAYGCFSNNFLPDFGLKPVLSVYATKIASRSLTKHMRVGYGGTGEVASRVQASVYDIGYADGFFRALSHRYKTPGGAAIVGRVSMDNCVFTAASDTLLVFNDARDVARYLQTIPYEVLTALKPDIPRYIVEGYEETFTNAAG